MPNGLEAGGARRLWTLICAKLRAHRVHTGTRSTTWARRLTNIAAAGPESSAPRLAEVGACFRRLLFGDRDASVDAFEGLRELAWAAFEVVDFGGEEGFVVG